MNNILLPLQFINAVLSKITFFIAMAIVCIMVLALSASALTRYISGHGFDWFIELPPALVSWLVFPMLGPLLKTGNHIEVDFVSTIISARKIKYIKIISVQHTLYTLILSNSFYRLFLKMLYSKIMKPILIDISAILNTGKFIIFKFIKSTTKPLYILSIPLPIVPPRIKL